MKNLSLIIVSLSIMSCSIFESEPINPNVVQDGFDFHGNDIRGEYNQNSAPPQQTQFYQKTPSPASKYVSPINKLENKDNNFSDQMADKYETLSDEEIADRAFKNGYNDPRYSKPQP